MQQTDPQRAKPQEVSFNAAEAARTVMAACTTGTLATLSADGFPFASFVTFAREAQGAPVMLLSRLAVHTQNLLRDRRASLLLVAPGGENGDPLAGARVTLVGSVSAVPRSDALTEAFLKAHPAAEMYIGFGDFAFYRLEVISAHLVAGFGRIVDLTSDDLGG